MRYTCHRCSTAERGFTLIELTIVIFIIGMLIAGLIGPVEVQLEARDRHTTRKAMDHAIEALYGYALTQRRLPCPDINGDGMSDPPFVAGNAATAVCDVNNDNGFLPWAELGVEPTDAWGNRYTYRVRHAEFTRPAVDTECNGNTVDEFDLCATGNITVMTRGDNAGTSSTVEGKFAFPAATVDNVVAVIVSHGRNGNGATTAGGVLRPAAAATHADERENTDEDSEFVSRGYTRDQSGCSDDDNEGPPLCEFDDIVVTVSRTILNGRMVAAGQLP